MDKKYHLAIDLSIAEADLKYTLQALKYELKDALKRVDPSFSLNMEEIQEESDAKNEPPYTANQPIWYDTGCGKLQAIFVKYIDKTVQIHTCGSMYPQSVYISTISPRDEKGGQG